MVQRPCFERGSGSFASVQLQGRIACDCRIERGAAAAACHACKNRVLLPVNVPPGRLLLVFCPE
jgi:hypothetical protein